MKRSKYFKQVIEVRFGGIVSLTGIDDIFLSFYGLAADKATLTDNLIVCDVVENANNELP